MAKRKASVTNFKLLKGDNPMEIRPLKVLVACEESQEVCKAFRALGHEAYSNDLIECSGGHPEWHLQMDCFEAIRLKKWDRIIMHPPCTKIALCGNSTYGKGMSKETERLDAIHWTIALWDTAKKHCKHVVMENPKNVLGKYIGKRTQVIHPYQFGHLEQKETWIWIHGLPSIEDTNNVYQLMMTLDKKDRERIHYMSPSKDRGIQRSKTFPGIAKAFAMQWGGQVNI